VEFIKDESRFYWKKVEKQVCWNSHHYRKKIQCIHYLSSFGCS